MQRYLSFVELITAAIHSTKMNAYWRWQAFLSQIHQSFSKKVLFQKYKIKTIYSDTITVDSWKCSRTNAVFRSQKDKRILCDCKVKLKMGNFCFAADFQLDSYFLAIFVWKLIQKWTNTNWTIRSQLFEYNSCLFIYFLCPKIRNWKDKTQNWNLFFTRRNHYSTFIFNFHFKIFRRRRNSCSIFF